MFRYLGCKTIATNGRRPSRPWCSSCQYRTIPKPKKQHRASQHLLESAARVSQFAILHGCNQFQLQQLCASCACCFAIFIKCRIVSTFQRSFLNSGFLPPHPVFEADCRIVKFMHMALTAPGKAVGNITMHHLSRQQCIADRSELQALGCRWRHQGMSRQARR